MKNIALIIITSIVAIFIYDTYTSNKNIGDIIDYITNYFDNINIGSDKGSTPTGEGRADEDNGSSGSTTSLDTPPIPPITKGDHSDDTGDIDTLDDNNDEIKRISQNTKDIYIKIIERNLSSKN